MTAPSPLTPSQHAKAAAIAAVVSPALAGLGRTLRWTVEGWAHWEAVARQSRPPILAIWHGRILPSLYYFRRRGIVVITSQNFDGEWIARILLRFGFGTARGSTSRGGARALVQMRRDLASGRMVGFTIDGPRGPAKVVQPGVIWLAGATGHPLLPFHVEAASAWTMRSWDRTQIPKPFSKMALVIGPAIEVAGTDEATVADKQDCLARSLETLEARALEIVGRRSAAT